MCGQRETSNFVFYGKIHTNSQFLILGDGEVRRNRTGPWAPIRSAAHTGDLVSPPSLVFSRRRIHR